MTKFIFSKVMKKFSGIFQRFCLWSKAVVRRCSSKLVFLKILQYPQVIPVLESLFNKVSELKASNYIKKKTPTQVFSCEYGKIFMNSIFIEHLRWLLLYLLRTIISRNPCESLLPGCCFFS